MPSTWKTSCSRSPCALRALLASGPSLLVALVLACALGSRLLYAEPAPAPASGDVAAVTDTVPADESRRLLGRLYIAQGVRLMDDQDDALGSLPWFVKAVEADPQDTIARMRVAAVLARRPRLVREFRPAHSAAFSPDGLHVATFDGDGSGQVWDLVTGEPIGKAFHDGGSHSPVAFNPAGPWMAQTARELTNGEDGFLNAPVTHVLMDRDTKFTAEFRKTLADAGAKPVLLPPSSPNCNAHLERFFRSLEDEALSRMFFFGETALRDAVREYLVHHHGERNHQGLDHKIIDPGGEVGQAEGPIACRERLGGLLRYYHRQAA